jgi:hypothetical protein
MPLGWVFCVVGEMSFGLKSALICIPGAHHRFRSAFRHTAVIGVHPAWYPLPSTKLAAHFHRKRGGRVLHRFLHSSELVPGATPQYNSEAAVRRLLMKRKALLEWLTRTGPVEPVRLSDLYADPWAVCSPGRVRLLKRRPPSRLRVVGHEGSCNE